MATSERRPWALTLACIAVALPALLVLYAGEFAGMAATWSSSETYRSLFFVPPLSLYFLWLRAPAVRGLPPVPAPLALAALLPCGLLWLAGGVAQVAVLAQLGVVGMLEVMFLALLGWQVWRQLVFPLLLLVLMVPMGEELFEPLLTQLTAWLTVSGLRLLGVPVDTDGAVFVVGGVAYSIIRECAGMRFVLANLLVSLVFANLAFHGWGRRLAYVLAAIPVAVVANNLRTISVVLITTAGIDLASDHRAYGWFVFGLAMLAQMAVGLRFRDAPPATTAAAGRGQPPAVAGAGATVVTAAAFLVGVALPPAYASYAQAGDEGPVNLVLCLPTGVEPLGRTEPDEPGWWPHFPSADLQQRARVWNASGEPVDLFIAYYWRQGPGKELVAWDNRFHGEQGWRVLAQGTEQLPLDGDGRAVAVQRLLGPDGQRRLVWYRYWVDGRFTADPVAAKLLQVKAALAGGDKRAAVLALSIDESGDPEHDRAIMRAALVRGLDYRGLLREVRRAGLSDAAVAPEACPGKP